MNENLNTKRILIENLQTIVTFSIQKLDAMENLEDINDINTLSEVLSVLVEATMKIFKENLTTEESLKLLIKDTNLKILGVLRTIQIAIQKNDQVILNDLIKYELKDILTEWKISTLPQIEKFISTSTKMFSNSTGLPLTK